MIHRDDLPFEMAEEIVKIMQELHPGYTVRFAGDEAGLLPQLDEASKAVAALHARSRADGLCCDCGKAMPGWPIDDSSEPPDGWGVYCTPDENGEPGNPAFYVCDECDGKEWDGPKPVDFDKFG